MITGYVSVVLYLYMFSVTKVFFDNATWCMDAIMYRIFDNPVHVSPIITESDVRCFF